MHYVKLAVWFFELTYLWLKYTFLKEMQWNMSFVSRRSIPLNMMSCDAEYEQHQCLPDVMNYGELYHYEFIMQYSFNSLLIFFSLL